MAFKLNGMNFGEGTGSSPNKQLIDGSNLKDKVASVANVAVAALPGYICC